MMDRLDDRAEIDGCYAVIRDLATRVRDATPAEALLRRVAEVIADGGDYLPPDLADEIYIHAVSRGWLVNGI